MRCKSVERKNGLGVVKMSELQRIVDEQSEELINLGEPKFDAGYACSEEGQAMIRVSN